MRDDRGGGEVMRSSRRLLRDQRVEVVEELKVLLPGAIRSNDRRDDANKTGATAVKVWQLSGIPCNDLQFTELFDTCQICET